MVVTQTHNINEFHSVWADSLVSIINHLANEESTAKKIMIFNIRQAYILYRMDNVDQRSSLAQKLALVRQDQTLVKKYGSIDYDYVLQEELTNMGLEKMSAEQLQIKMFTYMTLAGIKPVQNPPQKAATYSRFLQTTGTAPSIPTYQSP